MNKLVLTGGLIVMVLVLAGLGLASYMGYFNKDLTRTSEPVVVQSDSELLQPQTAGASGISKIADIDYEIQPVLGNLEVPWSLVFTDESRMLITERDGNVKAAIKNAERSWQLLDRPIHVFSNVSSQIEEGLMGMVLDPDYSANKYLYICYAYPKDDQLFDRVVRMTDNGSSLDEEKIIIDEIPSARFHAGCELGFGPDGKLYISTGDATDPQIAQDKKSLGGKILRINTDGTFPGDNPFPDSPVHTFGHRNPQGFDWHPENQLLYASEHGPSGTDGPGGGDEVNLIKSGQNYGWPIVSHQETQSGMVDPKLVFTPAIAPGSVVFYDSDQIPEFKNNIFMGMLIGSGILRIVPDPSDPEKILFFERIPDVDLGRIRELTMGPDGNLYFTTSNRDGRGLPKDNDDRIFRIVRKK